MKNQIDLLNSILKELDGIKKSLVTEDRDLEDLSEIVDNLKDSVRDFKDIPRTILDLKEDISDLKHTLLNPEDGVIVKVNKNTEFRLDREKKVHYDEQLKELVRWKAGVNTALWIIFTALVGIVVKIIFFGNKLIG